MSASIFFRKGYILFVGLISDLPLHSHITVSFCLGPDKSLKIRGDGVPEWTNFRSAFIPTGANHEVLIEGNRFATLLTEPGTEIAKYISKQSGQKNAKDSRLILNPEFGNQFQSLILSLDSAFTNEAIDRAFQNIFPQKQILKEKIDSRLIRIGKYIISSPEESINVDLLSAKIKMSESWIMHNFKSQFGIPIRKFRNWYRLKSAALLLKEGESLSQAAIGAGFYDQAHFNGVFRELFGIAPGFIFQKPEKLKWYIEEENYFKEFSQIL